MADIPRHYSGIINIDAQENSNITINEVHNHPIHSDMKTYDLSHKIPAFDAEDPQSLTFLDLDSVPIKNSFMLMLDGMVLSPASAVPTNIQNEDPNVIVGDYTFTSEDQIQIFFPIARNSAEDTPVLLARYAAKA